MAEKYFNVLPLLQNGVRLIPLKCIIDYRYTNTTTWSDLYYSYIYIYGTTLAGENVLLCENEKLIKPSGTKNEMSNFTTMVLRLSDKNITGIYVMIRLSEFTEIKRVSFACSRGSIDSGKDVSDAIIINT